MAGASWDDVPAVAPGRGRSRRRPAGSSLARCRRCAHPSASFAWVAGSGPAVPWRLLIDGHSAGRCPVVAPGTTSTGRALTATAPAGFLNSLQLPCPRGSGLSTRRLRPLAQANHFDALERLANELVGARPCLAGQSLPARHSLIARGEAPTASFVTTAERGRARLRSAGRPMTRYLKRHPHLPSPHRRSGRTSLAAGLENGDRRPVRRL